MSKRILFSANDAFAIINFRGNLVKYLVNQGHDVLCTGEVDGYETDLEQLGAKFIPFHIDKKGNNPIKEFMLIFRYIKHYKKIKPNLILQYTIKPNLYGTIAAKILRIPVINNITGLGIVFNEESFRRKIVEFLYKCSIKHPKVIFFQNKEDVELFQKLNILKKDNYDLLPGSGIDLESFKPYPKREDPNINFLFVGRLIKEKGIELYLDAAANLVKQHNNLSFHVCGLIPENSNLNQEKFKLLEQRGVFTYHGQVRNIKELHSFTDCLVLPTYYREGVPRSLIEAASSAIPIITADNVGCRDIVQDGYNGYLVNKNDYDSLYRAINKFIELSPKMRRQLGLNGRTKVENEFDEQIVIYKYVQYINQINE